MADPIHGLLVVASLCAPDMSHPLVLQRLPFHPPQIVADATQKSVFVTPQYELLYAEGSSNDFPHSIKFYRVRVPGKVYPWGVSFDSPLSIPSCEPVG